MAHTARLHWLPTGLGLACLAAIAGCWSPRASAVVVYAALDSEFSKPILDDFAGQTSIETLPKFDVESTKTVGLANAIIVERNRPRADVFWNNEILNTLRLRDEGLLDVYLSPVGQQYPQEFRAADGTWYGFAARARVLIVNTKLVAKKDWPRSIHDLTEPRWRGKVGIAKPLFGTTATHAACLFAAWGEEKAKKFFQALKQNDVQVLSGNKQVALAAASGQILFGLTDTDDAIIEKENGHPVEIIYPDRKPDQLGTLFIPNSLAIIKGCPHPQQARKLVDYLLRPQVEARLAAGPSAQIPLHPETDVKARVETPRTVKAMAVDFEDANRWWDATARFLRDEF